MIRSDSTLFGELAIRMAESTPSGGAAGGGAPVEKHYAGVANMDEYCASGARCQAESDLWDYRGVPFSNTRQAHWLWSASNCKNDAAKGLKHVAQQFHLFHLTLPLSGMAAVATQPNADFQGELRELDETYSVTVPVPGRGLVAPNGVGKSSILNSLGFRDDSDADRDPVAIKTSVLEKGEPLNITNVFILSRSLSFLCTSVSSFSLYCNDRRS